ncbi:MAG: PolC-type DNA polymerase III [Clostridiales bacterium]|nr:PolC-type DNA polymerase III [Clostridiales bacterium]
MGEQKPIPFYDIFSCCKGDEAIFGALNNALVLSATVDKNNRKMQLAVQFPEPVAPVLVGLMESEIKDEFSLNSVDIKISYPKTVKKAARTGKKAARGELIMGTPIKGKVSPMSEFSEASGKITVRGEVFAVDSRELPKQNAWVLSFYMTDYTGSVRVSRFMREENAREICQRIYFDERKPRLWLTVQGHARFNRYDNDVVLEPASIELAEAPKREDKAADKRVELHLHTTFSTLDALTNAAQAVNQAAAWGHKAIAITDHGVVQAFPEAWKAGKAAGIKVLFGTEAYYINDVDDRVVVHGDSDRKLTDELVAFDIETTGLDSGRDRITEIGAVRCKNGEITERFQTFVDPEMRIPANITQLTGISDLDVKGAPKLKEALKAFIDFAGDAPLCAHNADFDMGFIVKGLERVGLDYNPVSLDTLVMSQNLLPELRKHKLDIVAAHLGLPDFNHHRAVDDAVTVGHMLAKFIPRLIESGIETINEINPYMETLRQSNQPARYPRHMIILAKNKAGLKNLYKLISLSHLKYFKRNPIVPKSVLMQHREGLIIGSACEAGEIFSALTAKKSWSELKRLAQFYDYLEIQPLCNNKFMLYDGKAADMEELREYNRKIVRLAKELGKPFVATGDAHFLHPEHEVYRRILLAAKGFSDADRELPLYFKTTDEMLEEFSYLGKEDAYDAVVRYPNEIADMCQEIELLPKKLYPPTIENSAEDLKKLVYDRMHSLYGENPPELITKRINTELGDILESKYDVIYMSAQKLVTNSLEAGYLVGSRGSVGSSIVAYMSGITEVNSLPAHYRCPSCRHSDFESGKDYGCGADMPDKNCPLCGTLYEKDGFDIPFETFLGFGGAKVPDIDLNFSGEYQAKAHKYTEELFGSDHVFRAGTIGTLASKTAYGYVKKYLEERSLTVTKAEENRLTQGCVGVKRTTGQHPGGLVIIPQDMDVTDFCPVQRPADSEDTDIITTHFEYHAMEDNLLKLDELGHDDPTMIKMLEDMTGVDARKIRLDDPETMLIFKSPKPLGLPDDDPIIGKTGTIGIPEFGTGFTRQMLVDVQPEAFDTLVRLSGFSHGTDVWLGNAKDLILNNVTTIDKTIGCRDDIMLYLVSMGMDELRAFKIMESVRKGRGLTEEWEQEMLTLGVPEWYIGSCKKIKYLFPKAHAVAYVMMAFRIAWFKVHRPIAYYSAYFYRRRDSFDAEKMTRGIETVRQHIRQISENPNATAKELDLLTTLEACYEFYMRGFEFLPIDIRKSDATKFLIEGDALRPPFVAISGLGETAAQDLYACRDMEFVSVEELANACRKVSKTHIEQLKSLGALGDLPDTSQLSLF